YGKTLIDSLIFAVGWPVASSIPIVERYTSSGSIFLDFVYRDITIGVGGCVAWINPNTVHYMDVQFDDSTHISGPIAGADGNSCPGFSSPDQLTTGGNIVPFRYEIRSFYSAYRARVFTVPGVYYYRSAKYGTSGVVRVCDEHNDTTCAPN